MGALWVFLWKISINNVAQRKVKRKSYEKHFLYLLRYRPAMLSDINHSDYCAECNTFIARILPFVNHRYAFPAMQTLQCLLSFQFSLFRFRSSPLCYAKNATAVTHNFIIIMHSIPSMYTHSVPIMAEEKLYKRERHLHAH